MLHGNKQDILKIGAILQKVGYYPEFYACLTDECSKACLYGLLDNLNSDWAPVTLEMWVRVEEVSLKKFEEVDRFDWWAAYPLIQFRQGNFGWEYYRGKVLNDSDYLTIRGLLDDMEDTFSMKFKKTFNKKLTKQDLQF